MTVSACMVSKLGSRCGGRGGGGGERAGIRCCCREEREGSARVRCAPRGRPRKKGFPCFPSSQPFHPNPALPHALPRGKFIFRSLSPAHVPALLPSTSINAAWAPPLGSLQPPPGPASGVGRCGRVGTARQRACEARRPASSRPRRPGRGAPPTGRGHPRTRSAGAQRRRERRRQGRTGARRPPPPPRARPRPRPSQRPQTLRPGPRPARPRWTRGARMLGRGRQSLKLSQPRAGAARRRRACARRPRARAGGG